MFRPRTPPEAIALCSRLLEYTPTARLTPLEACAHSFFDELRDPNVKLPNGREKPSLFNFTTQGKALFCICSYEETFCQMQGSHLLMLFVWLDSELSSNPSLASILIPAHARNQTGASTPTNASATSGQPLFQTIFVLIWHPLYFGYSSLWYSVHIRIVCVIAVTVLTDQKLEHLFYQLCFYSMMYCIKYTQ